MQVDISIIIVNYNNFNLLDNCIASIIKFTKKVSYEIIVVDNNSPELGIDNIISKYPEINFIKNNINAGFSAANNSALKIAKGNYTLFLNNDTVFIENTLKYLIEYYELLNEKIILACRLLNQDLSIQSSIAELPSISNIIGANLFLYKLFPNSKMINKFHFKLEQINQPIDVGVAFGAFLLSKTEYYKQLNGFDESFFFYAEEMDLCKRFINSGGRIIYHPGTSVIHLEGATTSAMPWFKFKNTELATLTYYYKHFKGINFFIAAFFHYFGIIIRIPIFLIGSLVTLNKQLFLRAVFMLRQIFIFPKINIKRKQ